MATDCGRRSCDRDGEVSFSTRAGAGRVRCEVHALADGVDGVGESRAEAILEQIDLEDLVDRCEGADGAHAPTILSRIDGLGPSSAANIAKNLDESSVASAIRDGGR